MVAQLPNFKQVELTDKPPSATKVSVIEGRVGFIQQYPEKPIWDLCLYRNSGSRKYLGQIEFNFERNAWMVINIERQLVSLSRSFNGWHEAMGFLLKPVLEPEITSIETSEDQYYVSLSNPTKTGVEPARRIFQLLNVEGRQKLLDVVTNDLDPCFILAQLRRRFDLDVWGIHDCWNPAEPF